jgi:hypothetical protein
VQFDIALNVAWFLLGTFALAGTIRAAVKRAPQDRRSSAWLHVVGVGLIVAALFPYISATDDVLRVEHFNSQHDRQHSGKQSRTDDLMRLYETLDSPLACRSCEISVIFCFFAIIVLPVASAATRIAPLQAGRSPPVPA